MNISVPVNIVGRTENGTFTRKGGEPYYLFNTVTPTVIGGTHVWGAHIKTDIPPNTYYA